MHKLSDNMKGALLMMCSMAAFTFNDTCIKLIGPEMPLFQLLFLRGAVTTVLIYSMARYLGGIRLKLPKSDWTLIAVRTASEVGAAYFFITALMHMPIANVTAVLQVLPLDCHSGRRALLPRGCGLAAYAGDPDRLFRNAPDRTAGARRF